jgi:uncharacterized protein (TIGR02246 family)
MRKTSLSLFAAALLAATAIPAGAADPHAAEAGAKAAIESRMNEFVAAWNAHNPKAMAAAWAEDADVINPFGVKAKGRAEIEKLFEGEQGGPMKASTYTIKSSSLRTLDHGIVLGDWDCVITGIIGPDGQAMPEFPHHVTTVYVENGGKWWAEYVRAYGYLPPPGAPAK